MNGIRHLTLPWSGSCPYAGIAEGIPIWARVRRRSRGVSSGGRRVIICGTGPLVALLNKADNDHAACARLFATYPGRLVVPGRF